MDLILNVVGIYYLIGVAIVGLTMLSAVVGLHPNQKKVDRLAMEVPFPYFLAMAFIALVLFSAVWPWFVAQSFKR